MSLQRAIELLRFIRDMPEDSEQCQQNERFIADVLQDFDITPCKLILL